MKRTVISFIIGAVIFVGAGVYAGQYMVNTNTFPIQLNGEQIDIEGYNINDNTYFKLRDIAEVLGGFEVDFKDDTILLAKDGYEYDTKKEYIRSVSNYEDINNMFCTLEVEGHKFEVTAVETGAPHIRGNLYIDGNLFDKNVVLGLLTDKEYVYYTIDGEGWNGIYKLNLDTFEKKELIKTNEDYGIIEMYGKYLYADGDFTSDFRIYDLETDETIIVPGYFHYITEDEKIIYRLYEGEYYMPKSLYKANLDGSNPQLICDTNVSLIEEKYAYYINYIEEVGEDLYKMQIKRVNIETLETENVTDVHEAGYANFYEDTREIHFGKYGSEEVIIEKY